MKLDKMLTPPIKASVISFLFAFALIAANTARATEYFVDCNRPDDSGDGLSESTAKRTIQAAVEAAEADADTPRIVTVLPGTYAEGGKMTSYECDQEGAYKGTTLFCTNRLHIKKGLTLRAKDPTQLTEIVGAWDTSADAADASTGIGPRAVRCVLIETSSLVVISGFTLRDGAAQDDNTRTKGGYCPTFAGGVAYGQAAYNNYILVDCTIRNCSGRRGAACMGGRLIRCRVSGTCGPTLSGTVALNSVFYNQRVSRWGQYLLDGGALCNCTVFKTEGTGGAFYFSNGGRICNTLVFGFSTYTGSTGAVNATNSVVGCDWTGVGEKDENSVFGAPDAAYYMFKSPLDGDWRLRDDSEYLTLGDAKYIADFDWAADFEPYKDLDGNTIPASGAIAPGCTQSTFTPVCGAIRLNDNRIVVDGTRKAYSGSYFYSDDKFAQYRLTLTLAPGEYLHSWSAIWTYRRFPLPDDSLWVMPPADIDTRSVNTPAVTANALWVDPGEKGDDANDGTAERPFKSLLTAAQYAKDTWGAAKYAVVFAAAGTYTNDPVTVQGGLTRVTDYGAYIRFRGAGAYGDGKSIILGRLDATADGRGENAVRCASLAAMGYSCLQGFELRDGRCRTIGGNDNSDRGGGIHTGSLADCHVVSCGAGRGQVGYGAYLERCRLTTPDPLNGRILEGTSYAVACVVEDHQAYNLTDGGAWNQCTFHTNPGARLVGNGAQVFNSTSSSCSSSSKSWTFTLEGVIGRIGENECSDGRALDYRNVDVQFVDVANGDYRLRSTSPAVGYGSWKCMAAMADGSGYWKTYSPDINGKPILIFNGLPMPGAVQELVQVVEIAGSDYATVEPTGTVCVNPGESVTVTLSDALRPPIGFMVGDEEVAGMTYTYTAPVGGTPTNALDIAPLFGTNWYVNAAMPNDGGDGFTPETAKRTLCGAMTNKYVISGDVVHVAEGDYDEGFVMHSNDAVTKNRVFIKAGVTLQADGDMFKTRIIGEEAPVERSPSYPGCGEGATRCVYMSGTAKLRGFTVTGGRTEGEVASSSSKHYCYGGGISALTGAVIEDCLITNCVSRRGSGAIGGTFRRCRFVDIRGDAVATWNVYGSDGLFNCYFAKIGAYVNVTPLVNCFIAGGAPTGATAPNYHIYCSPAASHDIVNTVIMGNVRNTNQTAGGDDWACSNSVFTGISGTQTDIKPVGFGGQWTTAQIDAELNKDEHGWYVLKEGSQFINAGGLAAVEQAGEKDINGGQRVYDGAIDVGPWEWDWRPTYTRTIAQPGVSVRDAAPMVLKEDEKVRVYDGDLVMNWTASSRKATIRRRMTFTVTGTGTLTVFADGEELGTYTQAAEPQMIDFRNTLETSVVKFSYAKGADDTGYVEIGETIGEPGVLLIIR